MIFSKARMTIAVVWTISSLAILAIAIMQTFLNKFEDKGSEVWGWIISSIMPTLSLITSTYFVNVNISKSRKIDTSVYILALIISAFYILILFLIVLLAPLTPHETPLSLMQRSNLFMGPIQGMVTGSLGVFFYKEHRN